MTTHQPQITNPGPTGSPHVINPKSYRPKKLKYYVAVTEASAGASILGSGWSREEAIADAKANSDANVASILRVPVELAERIEEEGDTAELASMCYAKGESL